MSASGHFLSWVAEMVFASILGVICFLSFLSSGGDGWQIFARFFWLFAFFSPCFSFVIFPMIQLIRVVIQLIPKSFNENRNLRNKALVLLYNSLRNQILIRYILLHWVRRLLGKFSRIFQGEVSGNSLSYHPAAPRYWGRRSKNGSVRTRTTLSSRWAGKNWLTSWTESQWER